MPHGLRALRRSVRCVLITLRDGTRLLVRHVRPEDKWIIAKGWSELSEASQRSRFLAPKPRLTRSELRYLTEVDGHDHVALIALRADNWNRLAGVARFVRLADDPETAEVAITVGDALQGKGVGRQLGVLIADEARKRGVKRFVASILSDNVPALRLMQRMAARLEHAENGVSDLVADLAA
jgi:RimJ/RimL family protein N-acetyltransferase